MTDFAAARRAMVESQVRACGVTNPDIIDAMLTLPRELFVPRNLRSVAYADRELRLSEGRYLLSPMVFARLLAAAEIDADDVVLDVACGSGYSTAVLARLAAGVAGVESEPALVKQAEAALADLQIETAVALQGELAEGRPDQGPYDVIVINGGVDEVPSSLTDQLKDGGRLVAVYTALEAPKGSVWLRQDDDVVRRDVFDGPAPRLAEFAREPAFEF